MDARSMVKLTRTSAYLGLYHKYGKRLLDLVVVALILPLMLPVVVVVALLVRMKLGAPVIFRQTRAGQAGRSFVLNKFRTMTDLRDEQGNLAVDELRLTTLGNFLRASSFDELPGIWNVVRGDLSLVGPRPLLVEYLDRYSAEQAKRHDVKPGMTGLAQVMGRNSISWDEKLAYDVQYVREQSLFLDLRILWRTVFLVFQQAGISADGHATMPAFQGTQPPPEKIERQYTA